MRKLLAFCVGNTDIERWEAGYGRNVRQPGQIRKEAAVTNCLRVVVQSLVVWLRNHGLFEVQNPRPVAKPAHRFWCPVLLFLAHHRGKGMNAQTDQASQQQAHQQQGYQVLARKYRPATFRDLIGQEALVRTLTNAFQTDRLHHAFVLTGVRGVGKTTSARIIAKALNCIGADGQGGATPDPCGVCASCQDIAQDRHVDVMEMDAASRTGVDDVRELIESVRYCPVSARKKVYIIDEVHMLSKNAFNALLKTLEEPPDHVVFIFATTEINKVPVTVLSRCQRFDLRRVTHDDLVSHFKMILDKESIAVDSDTLALLARAADGSVRDGLSLVDQAIALSGGAAIEQAQVRQMLGATDRTRIFDLMELLLEGDCAGALDILSDLYSAGADPVVVIEDLLELSHFLTRARVTPDSLNAPAVPQAERERGGSMAQRLSLPVLARVWQLLLKGLEELRHAPRSLQAAEMIMVRLTHISHLPTPEDIIKKLTGGDRSAANAPSKKDETIPLSASPPPSVSSDVPVVSESPSTPTPEALPQSRSALVRDARGYYPVPSRFSDLVALARQENERIFATWLANDLHLVRYDPGVVEFNPGPNAPPDLAARLQRHLQDWTGVEWSVRAVAQAGVETLRQQERDIADRLDHAAMQDAMVQAVVTVFPGAKLVSRHGVAAEQFIRDGLDPNSDPPEPGVLESLEA